MRTNTASKFLHTQWKQHALKHKVTSTIHSSMVDTLNKVGMQVTGTMYGLWDKTQIIVALMWTMLGENIIYVVDKEETINSIIKIIQLQSERTYDMENYWV